MQQQDRSIRWRREGARDSLDSVLIWPSLGQRAPPSIDASLSFFLNQAPVVQKVDNAIHRINHYPLDIAIGFAITYPVDSDLSGG